MPGSRVSMEALADDLAAETAVLRALLVPLSEEGWGTPTPSPGWTIADQVSHLSHFDDVAVRSAVDPDAFRAELEHDGGVDPDAIAARYRHLSGPALLAWFDDARARLVTAFRPLDPSLRVPWFGRR